MHASAMQRNLYRSLKGEMTAGLKTWSYGR